MTAILFTSGPLAGRRVKIAEPFVLGRQADLSVDDPELSRRHLGFRPLRDGVEVEDLGSTNGTWVNDQRISAAVVVRAGDRIRAGSSELSIEREQAAATTTTFSGAYPENDARGARRHHVASRRLWPTAFAVGVIIVTAVGVVLYFALR